jgi:hypothetical protein
MKNLAIIFLAAILCAFGLNTEPAEKPAINRCGNSTRVEQSSIANPDDAGARQAFRLRGLLFCLALNSQERPLIMAKQKVVAVPLHVVQEIETTIRSARQAIGAINALGDRLMTVAHGEQNEYAHSIDWGLRTLANTAACKLHDDLENLKATIQERKIA